MNLITAAERLEIKASVKDVTDTFFVTEVTYRQARTVVDRFNEGQNNGTNAAFQDHIMPCKVKYMDDETVRNLNGSLSLQGVKLSFNADFWTTSGLYINGVVKASQTKDYVIVNGKNYKVVNIKPSGSFDTHNLLITVLADLQPSKTT